MKYVYKAPCGALMVAVERGEVCQCRWVNEFVEEPLTECLPSNVNSDMDAAVMENVISQFDEYFAGKRHKFDLPLHLMGTSFRKNVWQTLMTIPFGKTLTYSELADWCGCPGGQRAVAQACAANRLPIIIPCHRVVKSDSSLGGYTISAQNPVTKKGITPQGLAIKRFLLQHESKESKRY